MDFMVHLEDLSKKQLEKLIENEKKIDDFILDDEKLKSIKSERELIMAENRSIADDNLSKEPKLIQLKGDLATKYNRLKQVQEIYETNQGRMASLSKEENLDGMLAVLQTKLAESEERTESLEERFNAKEIDIADFIVAFNDVRKLAHLRRVKVDKLKALILEAHRNEVHRTASYPTTASHPTPRQRNTSVPSQLNQQTNNAAPYPAYPNYGQNRFPQPQVQPYPPQNQPYPGYSW